MVTRAALPYMRKQNYGRYRNTQLNNHTLCIEEGEGLGCKILGLCILQGYSNLLLLWLVWKLWSDQLLCWLVSSLKWMNTYPRIHSLVPFHIPTAKMGLVGFSHTLSLEGAKYNIFSNAIVPIAYSRMSASVMAPRKICWDGVQYGNTFNTHTYIHVYILYCDLAVNLSMTLLDWPLPHDSGSWDIQAYICMHV